MGWTASYQLLRDRPFDDAELSALVELCDRHNQPPWEGESFGLAVARAPRADRVIADGWQKLPMDPDSGDLPRLGVVLAALAARWPDVEIRVDDDFGVLGWNPDTRTVTEGRGGPAPVSLTSADRDGFVAPSTVVGPRFQPLAAELEAWLASDERASAEVAQAGLLALATMPDEHPRRAALIARLGEARPRRLARAGLAVYQAIARSSAAWRLVTSALERLEDPADIVAGFLHVWRNPHGIYWYGDMSFPEVTLAGLAGEGEVRQQWQDDVTAALAGAPAELDHRRAEHAATHLGRTRTTAAMITLVAGARATRGQPISSDLRYHTVPGLFEGLARAAVLAAVPSLLLELGTAAGGRRHHARALSALAAAAPARASELVAAIATAGEFAWEVVPALQQIGDATARAALATLCLHPLPRERERPRAALVALGAEPPPDPPAPTPEAVVAHPWRTVRDWGLDTVDASGDPARLAGFLIAVAVDREIRRRQGDDSGRGWRLLDRLPREVQRWPLDRQLAWLDAGGHDLPPQVVAPELAAVRDEGIEAVAARAPRPWPRLTAASERALIAEEAATLAALRAGLAATAPVPIAPAPVELLPPDQPAPPPIATVEDAPAAAGPAIDLDQLRGELIEVLAHEQAVSAELAARAGLAAKVTTMDSYDRGRAIRDRLVALGAAAAGDRLLAALPALHDRYPLTALAETVLPAFAATPGAGARLARLWDEAHSGWSSPSKASDLLASVAATPELLAALFDEIAAPDGGRLSARTRSAFELLGATVQHRELVIAALIARAHADRERPDERTAWRSAMASALRRLGERSTVATAVLDLASPTGVGNGREALLELVATRGRSRELGLLAAAVDLPGLSVATVKAICRSGQAAAEVREGFLAHPYWRVRLAAADHARSWNEGKLEAYAVWSAIDAAGLKVPDDDRRYARSDRDPPGATWDELAATHGPPIKLLPLPPARDSADASCADLRAWALWALDEAADPADLLVRVLADELDRALAGLGHARNGATWGRWRTKVPTLPTDRAGRLAWARDQDAAALSPRLRRVRDEGAGAVAAELPGLALRLSPELRAELEAAEAPLVARGQALLRDGMPPLSPPTAPATPGAASPPKDSYF